MARLMARVVFPEPPFCETSASVFMRACFHKRMYKTRRGRGELPKLTPSSHGAFASWAVSAKHARMTAHAHVHLLPRSYFVPLLREPHAEEMILRGGLSRSKSPLMQQGCGLHSLSFVSWA